MRIAPIHARWMLIPLAEPWNACAGAISMGGRPVFICVPAQYEAGCFFARSSLSNQDVL
jgi:hypothetical protein